MKCRASNKKLNEKEQEAFDQEINRQASEWTEKHRLDIDKIVLYTLSTFGFGKKRLRRFYEKFVVAEDELIDMYDNWFNSEFAADIKLNNIGVNVEAWYKEICENNKQSK